MRFNGQNCAAKYQIADEKVAGKTVRMKCRKCGEVIQVRARKTDSGILPFYAAPKSTAAPVAQAVSQAAARVAGAPPTGPAPRAPVAAGSQPDEATVVMSKELAVAAATGAASSPSSQPAPSGGGQQDADWFVGIQGERVGPGPGSYRE